MFEKELNGMDDMDQNGWNDLWRVVDMEGELRLELVDLNDNKEKHKKVVEKIYFLRTLLDRGKKVIDEFETNIDEKNRECAKLVEEVVKIKEELKITKYQIDNGLKLKGGNEVLYVVFNSQR